MAITDWTCPKCGVSNGKMAFKCATCQTPKPIFWICPGCKTKNPLAGQKCNKCKKARPAEPSGKNQGKTPSSPKPEAKSSNVKSNIEQSNQSSSMSSTSSFDIFKKLSAPSKTVRPVTYNDNDVKFEQALKSGGQFVDKSFPPTSRSLFYNPESIRKESLAKAEQKIQWLRYKEIVPEVESKEMAKLKLAVLRQPVSSDITQGSLGDCWLLSALAVLVEKPALLDRILAVKEISRIGLYRVRLFKDGRLASVIVDDMFPCNHKKQLSYSCAKRKQLFVPLIEKGMAKMYGSYEALISGQTTEGLSALTGYPCRSIKVQINEQSSQPGPKSSGADDEPFLDPDFIWTLLISYKSAGFLMAAACGISNNPKITDAEYKKKGLLTKHAYSIINVTTVKGDIRLLQLRNPWGCQVWNGDWSDTSKLWTEDLKKQLNPTLSKEGVFWIAFTDFQKYFEKVDVCKLRESWNESRYEGYFPMSCLDSRYLAVFAITVEESSTDLEMTLHQESKRSLISKKNRSDQIPIGIAVFQFKDLQKSLAGDFIDFSGYKIREFVGLDMMLDKGVYLLAMYAFNHWQMKSENSGSQKSGSNLRPAFIMSFHSSRAIQVQPYAPTPMIIGDTLIEMAISKGTKKTHGDQLFSYYLQENWAGLVVVVDNCIPDMSVEVLFDASESQNVYTTRGALLTRDSIPPMSRQLINVFSQSKSETPYHLAYQMSYKMSKNSSSEHKPEIDKLLPLHSTRSIQPKSGEGGN